MPFRRLLALILLLISIPLWSKARGYEIIANKSVPATAIDPKELKQIYLGELDYWRSGGRIRVARLSDASNVWSEFSRDVLDLTPNEFLNRWRYRLFSGRGIPPKQFESESLLISYVRDTEGAVGFIRSETVTSGPVVGLLKESLVRVLKLN